MISQDTIKKELNKKQKQNKTRNRFIFLHYNCWQEGEYHVVKKKEVERLYFLERHIIKSLAITHKQNTPALPKDTRFPANHHHTKIQAKSIFCCPEPYKSYRQSIRNFNKRKTIKHQENLKDWKMMIIAWKIEQEPVTVDNTKGIASLPIRFL